MMSDQRAVMLKAPHPEEAASGKVKVKNTGEILNVQLQLYCKAQPLSDYNKHGCIHCRFFFSLLHAADPKKTCRKLCSSTPGLHSVFVYITRCKLRPKRVLRTQITFPPSPDPGTLSLRLI